MTRLVICVATMHPARFEFSGPDIVSWTAHATNPIDVKVVHNTPEDNAGVVGSYQLLYEGLEPDQELLAYLHDDVECKEEGWDERVLEAFEDQSVAVVGFGGALHHGTSDLYKTPYRLQQLARNYYLSNVDDAETHGARFTGACDVAVLDGFALVIRRTLLDRIGGWNQVGAGAGFYCYDYAICALAHRLGYRVRVVGVRCHHHGGRTSVQGKEVSGSVSEMTGQEAYEKSHKWYYEEFRDVMPWRVKS